MEKKVEKLQPAVKKETLNVAIYTGVGTILMWIVFFVLHMLMKDDVPFDYTVILGGLGGFTVAVLNFFLMAVTVQKVAAEEDDKAAGSIMKASFSRRMLMQVLWLVAALIAPCFQWVAGFIPLLFPGAGIKLAGILKGRKTDSQEVKQQQDEY